MIIHFWISKNNYGYLKLIKDIQYSILDIQELIMDILKLIKDIHTYSVVVLCCLCLCLFR